MGTVKAGWDRTPAAASRTPDAGLDDIRSVYQPIVDLRTGDVVAYEALARGPAGTPLESPAALFARARELGAEAEVDWSCRAAAFRGALQAQLPASVALFVNVEPRFLSTPPPAALEPVLDQARQRLQVVVEITERALVGDPAALMGEVRRLREAGWGIALDDVGAEPESLALMPFIEPDVIKLDLRLVQDRPSAEIAMVINAVSAQAERSGAVVLAEGIETEEHRQRALAMGATLGQGWLLGRPAALPGRFVTPRSDVAFVRPAAPAVTTPFAAVERLRSAREAPKSLLLPMSHYLEGHALAAAEPPVLLAAFEHVRHFTPGTARRYERLATHCSFVAALGAGLPEKPADGVRGADLAPGDPLAGEWVVTTVGPHFAGALVARDLGDSGGPDADRRFAFVVTHDHDLVLRAGRALLDRVAPTG
jgi:EAL domain-containing protein (putative c-di-GMP-specific phosphodiesterase class I)